MKGKCFSCLRNKEKPSYIKANIYKPKKDKIIYNPKKKKSLVLV